MLPVFTTCHLHSTFLHHVVIIKNVDQGRGVVNATCEIYRGWEDTGAFLDARTDENDPTRKRPAWVVIKITIIKGKSTIAKVPLFQEKNVWVPYCRDAAVNGAYTVTQ